MKLFERIVSWLFPLEPAAPHPEEFDAGFAAYIDGQEIDANPFEKDSAQAQAWAAGWNDADAWAGGQF